MERRRAYSFRCRVTMLAETATSTSQVRTQVALPKSDYCAFDISNSIPFLMPGSQPIRSQAVCGVSWWVSADTL